MHEFTKSESYFRQALALDPSNTSTLYNLANCHFNTGEFNKAISVCQNIIFLDQSFYHAYNRIGLCHIHLENE